MLPLALRSAASSTGFTAPCSFIRCSRHSGGMRGGSNRAVNPTCEGLGDPAKRVDRALLGFTVRQSKLRICHFSAIGPLTMAITPVGGHGVLLPTPKVHSNGRWCRNDPSTTLGLGHTGGAARLTDRDSVRPGDSREPPGRYGRNDSVEVARVFERKDAAAYVGQVEMDPSGALWA